MKKIFSRTYFVLLLAAITLASCAQQEDERDLLGVISSEDLQEAPYGEWYTENTQGYDVDDSSLSDLKTLLDGVEIKIVMGTWCHDSKREVPRFYKILEAANGNVSTEMIALDRNKQAPAGEIDGMAITNTPTFIFYKDGQELNRIVETPVEGLETDMINILSGQPYTHSKMLPGQ
jgi:thiol-disulfide isomerase/thioredoxin